MFGVSLPELILVFVIVLIAFGPEKLPEIARTLGKLAGNLKKSSDSVRRDFYDAFYEPADKIKNDFESKLDLLKEPIKKLEELEQLPEDDSDE